MINIQGIYAIKNIINNKVYIGQSVDINKRFKQHLWGLNHNRHDNPHLQNSWNKYKEENFEFIVLEEVEDINNLDIQEQYWIDEFNSYNDGYNLKLGGVSGRGYKFSEKSKQKMSEAKKGKPSPNKGVSPSKETREKIRESNILYYQNNPVSEETRRKISITSKGRKCKEEVKEKLRQDRIGKPRPREYLEKAWEANRGRIFTAEQKKELSNRMLGKTHTKETREKISKGHRRFSDEDIIDIYNRAHNNEPHINIANDYNVDVPKISRIKNLKVCNYYNQVIKNYIKRGELIADSNV